MSPAFFTDRDLGRRFPEILRSAGLTVELHDDLFPPDTSDEEWLEHVGAKGSVAITHNQRIRYTPNQREAVRRHGVALLVVVGKVPLPLLAAELRDHDAEDLRLSPAERGALHREGYRPPPAELERDRAGPGSIAMWLRW